MTGFSKIEVEYAEGRVYGEARALNSRYLEINIKLPKTDYTQEQRLRELVKQYVKRGKVDISIKWEKTNTELNPPRINEYVVKQYVAVISLLKEKYGLKGDLTVDTILNLRDIITYEENNSIPEDALALSFESLLRKLDEERIKEGGFIEKDLRSRLEKMLLTLSEIEERQPWSFKNHEHKLREKIAEATQSTSVDENRMLQELAIYMERLDISEEIVRLKGHALNFMDTLNTGEPMGRKLDFIIQEMVRETNTIGSKSSDLYINERIVQIKVEIERMREQVQNVE